MICRVDDLFQSVPGQPSVSPVQKNCSRVVDQACSAECLCVVRSFENHEMSGESFAPQLRSILLRPRPMAGTGAESRALDREVVVRNLSHAPRCQRRSAEYCPSTGPPLLVQVKKWRYRSCTYSAVSLTNFNFVEFP